MAKNQAMSESRTFPPDADAAKSGLRRQTYRNFRRGSAARLPQSGHSNRSNTFKSNPVVRCDGVERLTCGQSSLLQLQHLSRLTKACKLSPRVRKYLSKYSGRTQTWVSSMQ